jgi:murein DD-endopeptidase MepM/ murein hydrolase activator NlpD
MNLRYTLNALLAQLKSFLKPYFDEQFKTSKPLFSAIATEKKLAVSSKKFPTISPSVSTYFRRKKGVLVGNFTHYFTHFSVKNKIAMPSFLLSFYGQKKAIFDEFWVDFMWEHPVKMPTFLSAFYADKKELVTDYLDDNVWLKSLISTHKTEVKMASVGLVYLFISTLAFSIKNLSATQNKALSDNTPKVKYGFNLTRFATEEDKIKQGDVVFSILKKHGLTTRQADSLLAKVKPSYDFEKIKIGKPYTLFCGDTTQYLVIEPDAKRYFVFNVKDPSVSEVKRPVSVREFEVGGKLRKTLYSSLASSGMSYSLIDMVQAALKNKFDFSKCEEGDEYKLIWEEELVDGHSVGIKKLKSVYVKGQCITKPVYAFYFANEKERGWYEKDSLPIRDGFIDSPVKNSKITSSFNLHRFHPILHYTRPHYGTDYAAPSGTPIMSVADGVVEEAKYSGTNGNYVKIQHKNTYETQYLHMSRFARGIKTGTIVKQKQVIGYVGSTGLATGPHVCFRFKKLGTPINHLTERIYSTTDSQTFKKVANNLKSRLNKIAVLSDDEQAQQRQAFLEMRKKR